MAITSYDDYYSPAEYDKELDKILTVDDPFFAAHFYHAVSKVGNLFNEQTITLEAYGELCDYLVEKFDELPFALKEVTKLEDLKNHMCTLVQKPEGEAFVKGVHYYDPSTVYLEELEENMFTDFSIESWEDNASTY